MPLEKFLLSRFLHVDDRVEEVGRISYIRLGLFLLGFDGWHRLGALIHCINPLHQRAVRSVHFGYAAAVHRDLSFKTEAVGLVPSLYTGGIHIRVCPRQAATSTKEATTCPVGHQQAAEQILYAPFVTRRQLYREAF